MFGKGGMGNLMKQAQQMQDRMQKMQEEIANMEVTGEAGAGLVKVTITGSHSVRRVELDDSLMEDDKEMLEDSIHYNKKGHKAVADKIILEIKKTLNAN